MRRLFIAPLVAVFAFACADAPSAPLLEPMAASFAEWEGEPPPPWAIVHGGISSEHGTVSFTGGLFINKPGNAAWLQIKTVESLNGGTATVSSNARIRSVNGKVTGTGTISVGGGTIYLNDVSLFAYQTYRTDRTVSFAGRGQAPFSGNATLARGECGINACDNF